MYYLKLFFVAMIASLLTIGLAGWQAGDAHDADMVSASEGEQEQPADYGNDDEDDEKDEWGEGDG